MLKILREIADSESKGLLLSNSKKESGIYKEKLNSIFEF